MTRRKAEQLALDVDVRTQRGRVERAVDTDAAAARKAGAVEDTAGGLLSAARAVARAIDVAERTRQVYALPQLSRELRDLYAALGFVTQKGEDGGALEALVDQLGAS